MAMGILDNAGLEFCPFKSRVTPSGMVSVWVMVAGCHSLTVPPPLWAAFKAASSVSYLVEEPP